MKLNIKMKCEFFQALKPKKSASESGLEMINDSGRLRSTFLQDDFSCFYILIHVFHRYTSKWINMQCFFYHLWISLYFYWESNSSWSSVLLQFFCTLDEWASNDEYQLPRFGIISFWWWNVVVEHDFYSIINQLS